MQGECRTTARSVVVGGLITVGAVHAFAALVLLWAQGFTTDPFGPAFFVAELIILTSGVSYIALGHVARRHQLLWPGVSLVLPAVFVPLMAIDAFGVNGHRVEIPGEVWWAAIPIELAAVALLVGFAVARFVGSLRPASGMTRSE